MSSENDERIAAAIAKRKAVIKAEEEQARAAQDAQKKRQMTYDQAAGKFRQDFRNIEVFIEMRNSGLHDIGIILGGDGGRASQNGNHLNYTVNMNRPPNGRQFSLVFSLTDKGLSHHIETIAGNRRNASPTINASDADSKYYDDALTEYIETILAAYED